MSIANRASREILPTTNRVLINIPNGNLNDIVRVIMEGDKRSKPFTTKFAPRLRKSTDMKTLEAVWRFVKHNIRYVPDRDNEDIKSPGKTWEDRYGDCKSFSVMIGSILKNLGYKYKYRVAFYDKKNPYAGHIYPIVKLPNGREVFLDAVHKKFNDEVPYRKAYDYKPGKTTGLQKINGTIRGLNIGNVVEGAVISYLVYKLFNSFLTND